MKSRVFICVFTLLGMILSLYSVDHHIRLHTIGRSDAICNINAEINCDQVALSSFSEIGGIPLGVFGTAYFAAILLLMFFYRRTWSTSAQLRFSMTILLASSLPAAAALFYISVGILKAICPVCIGIYICIAAFNLIMLSVIWRDTNAWQPGQIVLRHLLVMGGVTVATSLVWLASQPLISKHLLKDEQLKYAQLKIHDMLSAEIFQPRSSAAPIIRIGNPDSPVHVVKYVDFECGFCRLMWEPIKRMAMNDGEKIRLEIRQLPLHPSCNSAVKKRRHPLACELAAAAYCSSIIGRAEDFSNWAFENQGRIGIAAIRSKLEEFGGISAAECLSADSTQQAVASDIKSAIEMGAKGTPYILINGRRYIGALNTSGIARAIELVLQP